MPTSKFTEAPPRCQLRSLGCQNFCESPREIELELCRQCLELRDARFSGALGEPIQFGYTNYRGEYSERRATPIRFEFQSTEHHPEQQWIMHAMDHDKGLRAFALADMVLGYRKPVLPPFADRQEVKARFPNTSNKAVQRIAELEQMVADLVVTGASMTLADMDIPARFSHWDNNIREKRTLGSTMNMTTERKTAYTAGFTSGLGCIEKENQDIRLQAGGMQMELDRKNEALQRIYDRCNMFLQDERQMQSESLEMLREIAGRELNNKG